MMSNIKTMPIPLDPRYEQQTPKITNTMKTYCIGEYRWKEEAPYYDENGELHEHTATREVPWDLCKTIYKQMATMANASPEMEGMNETTGNTALAGRHEPFVITLGQFEEAFKALPSKRAFIFAKYKGKWRKVIAEFNRGNIIYYFFNDSNVSKNRLMSEHFTMVSVPQKPDAL